METIRTNGFTAKDLFNATSATPIKDVKGLQINVVDVMVTEKDGEVVGYMKADDGTLYATISATVNEQIAALAEILNDMESVPVVVITQTSKNGREYFMLEMQ